MATLVNTTLPHAKGNSHSFSPPNAWIPSKNIEQPMTTVTQETENWDSKQRGYHSALLGQGMVCSDHSSDLLDFGYVFRHQ
jgi:hypothetical protein